MIFRVKCLGRRLYIYINPLCVKERTIKMVTGPELIYTVRNGELEKVVRIIDSVGLFYAKEWSGGYVLLLEAIKNKRTEVIELLLLNGARVNSKQTTHYNKKTMTPLHYAVRYGYVEIVRMLLDRNAEVDARDIFDRAPLCYAAKANQVECVKILLNYRANINVRDNGGKTPLHYAAESGSREVALLLLKKNCDVNTKALNKITALHFAAENGYLQIAEDLLSHGAYINSQINCVGTSTEKDGYTPLHYAVQKNNQEIVTLLLKNNCDINAKASNKITPLHIAAENGNLQIVEDLLNHGAYINSQINCVGTSTEKDGYTPLHLASANKGSAEVVKLLLSKGADVNANVKDSVTPLSVAVQKGHETIVKSLLEHGADVDAQDKKGKSVLYLAVERGHLEIVEHILNFHPDVSNRSNRSSLRLAIESFGDQYGKVVKSLLNYGFTVTSDNINNGWLLFNSVEKGYFTIVEDLLQKGADVNMISSIYLTGDDSLLYMAIKYKQADIVQLLIENGANINIRNYVVLIMYYNFYDDNEERKHFITKTANILVQHIVKLKAQNLSVNEDYSRSISKNRDLVDFYTSCESEVIEMRCEKIGNTNVTFYDILTKDINQLAMYTRNEDILHVLESQVYQEIFPIYADMIHNRFIKAQKRQRLLNSSVKCINLLFGYELPELFTNQMFRYLSVMDLENLMEACPNYNINDDDQLTSMQDV